MTLICHLFDGSTGWEQRVGVLQLLANMPRANYTHTLAAIHPDAARTLSAVPERVAVLGHVAGFGRLSAPAVTRFVLRGEVDLIHAWGLAAGAAARVGSTTPLVIQIFDPQIAHDQVKLLRTLARRDRFAVVCTCEIVRRRLIEGGFPAELSVVIRPGVDFGFVTRCRRGPLRKQLGLGRDDQVVIVPQPVTRASGSWEACNAAALCHHLASKLRIIIPGQSREKRRITNFLQTLPVADPLVAVDPPHPFEELLAVADTLLAAPRGDISTTCIAWAMASGVAVIGTAVGAVTEMIAHKVNGLLVNPKAGRSMVASISRLLQDPGPIQKCTETARGQAYEVFGLRRSIEQYVQLYENLLNDAAPGRDIVDSCFAR